MMQGNMVHECVKHLGRQEAGRLQGGLLVDLGTVGWLHLGLSSLKDLSGMEENLALVKKKLIQ